jgi:hypothetical protein
MLSLSNVVDRYASMVRNFGDPVGLAAFGLTREETQTLFTSLEEDYHISRFLHFSKQEGTSYIVSGDAATHVSIDAAIRSVL